MDMKRIMKIKPGFLLKKMLNFYVAVPIGEATEEFYGMIQMNETGAFFWKELEKGISEEALIRKMLERYEDLDEETAKRDLKKFLSDIHGVLQFEV